MRLISQVTSLVVIYFGLTGLAGLVGTSLISNGLILPVYACFYPQGRTVTCWIWSIQSYVFPFFDIVTLTTVVAFFIGMTFLVGRFWCGWICPMGLLEDLESRLRHQVFRIRHAKVSEGLSANLSQLRYIILAVILIISFIIGSEFFLHSYGRAAADSLSVPFCQVCPVKPLFVLTQTELGLMSRAQTYAWYGVGVWAGMYVSSVNVFSLSLFLISAFAIRRVWCRICPAGGTMGMLSRFWLLRLEKDETRCTKCGICKRVCPLGVTEVYEEKGGDVTSTNCMLCLRCVEMCPYEDALKATFLGNVIYKSKNWLRGKFI